MAMGMGREVVQRLELPKEVILDMPLISLTGREEISVENHKGLLEYSEERIRIGTKAGSLCIRGSGMVLRQMTAECIVAKGRILGLEFLS